MGISISKCVKSCPEVAFSLLFPGFFFYNTLLGFGFITPFLKGYFSIVSIIIFPIIFLRALQIFKRERYAHSYIDICFFLIIIFMITNAFAGYLLGDSGVSAGMPLLRWSLLGVLYNLVCYVLGKTIDFSNRWFAISTILMSALIILLVLSFSEQGIYIINSYEYRNTESLSTYQGLARSIAACGFFSLLFSINWSARLVVFLFSASALYLNGARSEFFAFTISCVCFLILRSCKNKFQLLVTIIASFTIFSGLYYFGNALLGLLPNSRILQIVDLSTSSSAQSRKLLTEQAWNTISQNLFFGDYGSYALDGEIGEYSHNLLSAWVNLGLLGFLAYIFIMLSMLYLGVSQIVLKRKSQILLIHESAFLFVLFTVVSLLYSKDYTYMFFGFSVGLCSRCLSLRKRASRSFKSSDSKFRALIQ